MLTDPAECGPVTLALCQDTQAEAYDYPESFFAEKIWTPRRIRPDESELARGCGDAARRQEAVHRRGRRRAVFAGPTRRWRISPRGTAFRSAKRRPASRACRTITRPISARIGVTGTAAANALAEEADVVLAVGTRLQDFTTGSWALFKNPDRRIIGLNVQTFDATKHNALPLVADAQASALRNSAARLAGWKAPGRLDRQGARARRRAGSTESRATRIRPMRNCPPTRRSIGAVQRTPQPTDVVVCAAGGLPGELHKHWKARTALGYHMEYGYSCMGYEIAGGLGVKMADPTREVIVMVGDGSYLMMNSELATSVMLGLKLTIVLLDNRGYGCINRLQRATGGESFNNLLQHTEPRDAARRSISPPMRQASARSADQGRQASPSSRTALEEGAQRRCARTVIVIDTDPLDRHRCGRHIGGTWRCRKCRCAPQVNDGPQIITKRPSARSAWAIDHKEGTTT